MDNSILIAVSNIALKRSKTGYSISYKITCAPSEDLDLSAYQRSLMRAVAGVFLGMFSSVPQHLELTISDWRLERYFFISINQVILFWEHVSIFL